MPRQRGRKKKGIQPHVLIGGNLLVLAATRQIWGWIFPGHRHVGNDTHGRTSAEPSRDTQPCAGDQTASSPTPAATAWTGLLSPKRQPVQNEQPSLAPGVSACRSPPAATAGQLAPVTLQDVLAMPGLGAQILGAVPLADRVQLRRLCRAFASSVDASLQLLERVSSKELLSLVKEGRSNGDVLKWLASKCPNLQALETHVALGTRQHWWERPAANGVVTHVATLCRQLQTLSLRGCDGLNDAGLLAVAASCGKLRHLDLCGCHLITDAGLWAVGAGCCQLEHLNVGHIKAVTDASMVALAAHCPRLRQLSVRDTGVGDAGILSIARRCPDLRTLDVSKCKGVGDDGMVAVAFNCSLVESLDFSGAGVGDRGTAAVMFNCSKLKELHLVPEVTDRAIHLGPASCRQLRHLSIASKKLSPAVISSLAARCGELTYLRLLDRAATDATIIMFSAKCPHLEALIVYGSGEVTDAGVLAVASACSRLSTLNIGRRCQGVTDASLDELRHLRPLLQVLRFG